MVNCFETEADFRVRFLFLCSPFVDLTFFQLDNHFKIPYHITMKILMAGDTHGDKDNISSLMNVAVSNNCEKILQVGDFGYFPHIPKYDSFLDFCSAEIYRNGIPIHFIRGNHDNIERLNSFGPGIHSIRDGLFYHSDGFVWEWNNKKFVGIGGAYSVDKGYRTEGIDWRRDEQISNSLVYSEIEHCDYLISHDTPISGDIEELLDFRMDAETIGNRMKLQSICEMVRPEIVIHGHYHKRYDCNGTFSDGSRFLIRGLGANTTMLSEQYLILEI